MNRYYPQMMEGQTRTPPEAKAATCDTGRVDLIDLNADLGEEALEEGSDESMLEIVTSASVACGFHAGDPGVMHRTIQAALEREVVIGAHPSYADREGFGRTDLEVDPVRLTDDVLYQVGGLEALARAHGARVGFVKPHGALYNRMAVDPTCARAVCEATRALGDLVLLAPARSVVRRVASGLGVEVAEEVFADRAYLPDGRLVPRSSADALVTVPAHAARRAVSLVTEHVVETVDGGSIELDGESICVHGDTPGALAVAREVRSALLSCGVTLRSFVV
jgi:5-oxoprolinase (ATP-hydrolysing) subunit A